jgi:predicted MFS family arabinose efflux permease
MIMCLFGVIILNNYVIYPYLSLFIEAAPMMEIPTDMWSLLKLGIGGYVVGRTVEKIAPGALDKLKKVFGKDK